MQPELLSVLDYCDIVVVDCCRRHHRDGRAYARHRDGFAGRARGDQEFHARLEWRDRVSGVREQHFPTDAQQLQLNLQHGDAVATTRVDGDARPPSLLSDANRPTVQSGTTANDQSPRCVARPSAADVHTRHDLLRRHRPAGGRPPNGADERTRSRTNEQIKDDHRPHRRSSVCPPTERPSRGDPRPRRGRRPPQHRRDHVVLTSTNSS